MAVHVRCDVRRPPRQFYAATVVGAVSVPAAVGSSVREDVAAHRLVGGRYRIERLLGGGGMATVWGGRDLWLDRPVAIKELSGEGLRQPMALGTLRP